MAFVLSAQWRQLQSRLNLVITVSPISAAVVYYLAQLSDIQHSITLLSILLGDRACNAIRYAVTFSLYSLKRGKELNDDPDYQARLKDPEWKKRIENTTATSLDEVLPKLGT